MKPDNVPARFIWSKYTAVAPKKQRADWKISLMRTIFLHKYRIFRVFLVNNFTSDYN